MPSIIDHASNFNVAVSLVVKDNNIEWILQSPKSAIPNSCPALYTMNFNLHKEEKGFLTASDVVDYISGNCGTHAHLTEEDLDAAFIKPDFDLVHQLGANVNSNWTATDFDTFRQYKYSSTQKHFEEVCVNMLSRIVQVDVCEFQHASLRNDSGVLSCIDNVMFTKTCESSWFEVAPLPDTNVQTAITGLAIAVGVTTLAIAGLYVYVQSASSTWYAGLRKPKQLLAKEDL